MHFVGLIAIIVGAAACGAGTINRQSLRPLPELPPAPATPTRGRADAAARVADEDQVMIVREVVRRFFRPLRGQARWLDPRPLAHERGRIADSAMALDESWVLDIVLATNLSTVCPLTEANLRCQGMPGAVLRFSEPYSVGTDSAMVYATSTPVERGETPRSGAATTPGWVELEFHLARRDGVWSVVNRRTILTPGTSP